MAPDVIAVCGASRPFPGERANGDAWTVDWHEGCCRIAVIDGLGHGHLAEEAATTALTTLHSFPRLHPEDALRRCHEALTGTRGAAMAVVWIDPTAARLRYGAIGNIEALLLRPDRLQRLVSYRGYVGGMMRTVRAFEYELGPDWLLILHSDGIPVRMELPPLADLCLPEPQALADSLLETWARPTDDATVVVVRPDVVRAHSAALGNPHT